MPTRIYQPTLQINTRLSLSANASHHLTHVLRMRVGESVSLFNGQGGEYAATITQIHKKGIEVEIHSFNPNEIESPLSICLAQGIARGEKMDFYIQKAVELGVNTIIPLITERTNVRLSPPQLEKRLQHWQAIVISACEQCGRNQLPTILTPLTLPAWLPQVAGQAFVLTPHTENPANLKNLAIDSSITLLIGPEGGLSADEIKIACAQGFMTLRLGPRVLRTETATLAALTALQCWYGDLQ